MSKTFSGTITNTISLTSANAGYNPVKIIGTVTTASGDGVDGQDLAWTVTNTGTIDGNQRGIVLAAGGTVTNGSSKVTTSSIVGRNGEGIRIGTAAGTVTNFGNISGSSSGIQLDAGGKITNGSSTNSTASISGGSLGGIYASGAATTVTNFGSISGFFSGIRLNAGGGITNNATGSITAGGQGVAIVITGAAGTIKNLGTIQGGAGIILDSGGVITNGSTASSAALIAASPFSTAIRIGAGGGTVNNFGTVNGYNAVYLTAGGRVTNHTGAALIASGGGSSGILINGGNATIANSGKISGAVGVRVTGVTPGPVTLSNAGTIIGSGGIAVQFGEGDATLNVQAGAKFVGTVHGGNGNNTLNFETTGSISLTRFSAFDTINLSSAGPNSVVLRNGNFAGMAGQSITVNAGSGGDRLDASAVGAANAVVLNGAAGADTLIAGKQATLTGKNGDDTFIFSTTGKNTVTDFGQGNDIVSVSNNGFSLGLPGASTTPQALPSELFTSNATGSFDNATERFAYSTDTGKLFFDADGNGAGSSKQLVAQFTGNPTLTASNMFFTS